MSETRQLICFLLLVWVAIWAPIRGVVEDGIFESRPSLADLDRAFIERCVSLAELAKPGETFKATEGAE